MAYENGVVRHIMLYPIKSAGGVEVEKATITRSGLTSGPHKDHQFMLVRTKTEGGVHDFITQRDKRYASDVPQGLSLMALVRPTLNENGLRLTYDGKHPIDVPLDYKGEEIPVRVWDHIDLAVDQGPAIADWFSDNLKLPVRLVKAAGSFSRKARQSYAKNQNPLRFQDGYPIHWFTIESVNELSDKVGINIPWQAFRPQVVVDEMSPRYEHLVSLGRVNGVLFLNPKPCDRCQITLVDPETGKVRGKEPLATLAQYKRWKNIDGEQKVIFGENMLPLDEGEVSIGDELMIESHRKEPLVYGGPKKKKK